MQIDHAPVRRRALAGLALALAATAFAPAAPASSSVARDVPEVRVELTQDGPVRTLGGMADRSGLAPGERPTDRGVGEARLRRVLDAAGHATVRATDGSCVDACPSAPTPTQVGTWRVSVATADLDGDGTDDVLVLSEDWDDGEAVAGTVAARSGATGALLWEQPGTGFVSAVPDVDGDALPDLVTWSFLYGFGHGPADCVDPLAASCDGWHERVDEAVTATAFAGTTGARLASTELAATYETTYRTSSDPTGTVWRDEVEATYTDAFVGLAFLDVDGDDAHELVHDRTDVTYVGDDASTWTGLVDLAAGTTAEDLSGEVVAVDLADGTATQLRADDGAALFVSAVDLGAGPQLLLDRFPEFGEDTRACAWALVVDDCVFVRDATGSAAPVVPTRVLHGVDLSPLWEVPTDPTSWFALPAGGDVDGDGVGDLVDLRFDEVSWDDEVALVSGATGADLWTAPGLVAAVSGDEVVATQVEFTGDEDTEQVRVLARRLDPGSGTVRDEVEVAAAQVTVPDVEGDVLVVTGVGVGLVPLVGTGPDVLADAVAEVVVLGEDDWECEPEDDEECWGPPGEVVASAYELGGVDAADLGRVVHRTAPGGWILDVADLDGDARAELLTIGEGVMADASVVAERLDGSVLWSLPASSGWGGLLGTPTNPDVVLDEDGRTVVRRGSDLSQRWAA